MDQKKTVQMMIGMICLIAVVLGLVLLANKEKLSTATKQQTGQTTEELVIEEDGKVHQANLSAFLNDEAFFDHGMEQSHEDADQLSEELTVVSLMITSVEKDLRMKVVDEENNIVKGHPFSVVINDTQTILDEDEDGILYVSDLKPGRYQVSLQPIDGYQVPENVVEARVKSIISFTVIEDISYLVHEETDIDVSKDDTENADADTFDSDDSQYTNLIDTDTLENAVQLGIDVSKWNGEIDWDAVKADGVEFAIIRCGYRGSSSGWLVEDPYFYQNLKGAKQAGLKVGLYFFTQAINVKEAIEEASTAISLLGDESIDYPIYIDIEGAGGNGRADGLDATARTAIGKAFCKTIVNAGYEAGVYSSRNWYYNNLMVEELQDYHIWLAEYRDTPLYTGTYDMWQYTSSGSVKGINGRVDLNVKYQ